MTFLEHQIPPSINPYLDIKKFQKPKLGFDEYIEGILNGDRVILSRAITLIESDKEEDKKLSSRIIQYFLKKQMESFRIGITGVPGVGKSTFIEAFGLDLISKGHKVAVLAVDPSSERSGGSILGDKTRMENLSKHPHAFIRPSPSRGTLGGVAKRTREVMLLCEAAGFNRIIIETVGVGQSETLVHSMVDFFLLLILPGSGDELQGIKRGIMEMADGILVTKTDGDNIQKSKIAKADIQRVVQYFSDSEINWKPFVICVSSLTKEGFPEFYEKLELFLTYVQSNQDPFTKKTFFEMRREIQSLYWFEQVFFEDLKGLIKEKIQNDYIQLKEKILKKELSPFEASQILIQKVKEFLI
ncbi:MAG: methylmalonyl Co-A mutase-associated GTPase MeaB [Leptonema sp. (in: bacteria)]